MRPAFHIANAFFGNAKMREEPALFHIYSEWKCNSRQLHFRGMQFGGRMKKGALSVAATKGRLDGLRALRDVLTAQIEDQATPPAAVAALAGRLTTVLDQIEALEREQPQKSRVDELANRRKTRRAGATGAADAPGDRVDRRAGGRRAR
jgi:hypothetical protein